MDRKIVSMGAGIKRTKTETDLRNAYLALKLAELDQVPREWIRVVAGAAS